MNELFVENYTFKCFDLNFSTADFCEIWSLMTVFSSFSSSTVGSWSSFWFVDCFERFAMERRSESLFLSSNWPVSLILILFKLSYQVWLKIVSKRQPEKKKNRLHRRKWEQKERNKLSVTGSTKMIAWRVWKRKWVRKVTKRIVYVLCFASSFSIDKIKQTEWEKTKHSWYHSRLS